MPTHLSFIDMVVIPLIRTANDHHDEIFAMVRTEIVDRRFEQMRVLGDPFRKVERWAEGHCDDVPSERGSKNMPMLRRLGYVAMVKSQGAISDARVLVQRDDQIVLSQASDNKDPENANIIRNKIIKFGDGDVLKLLSVFRRELTAQVVEISEPSRVSQLGA